MQAPPFCHFPYLIHKFPSNDNILHHNPLNCFFTHLVHLGAPCALVTSTVECQSIPLIIHPDDQVVLDQYPDQYSVDTQLTLSLINYWSIVIRVSTTSCTFKTHSLLKISWLSTEMLMGCRQSVNWGLVEVAIKYWSNVDRGNWLTLNQGCFW